MAVHLNDDDLETGPAPRQPRQPNDGARRTGGGRGGPPVANAAHIEAFEFLFPTASALEMRDALKDHLVLAILDAYIGDESRAEWAADEIDRICGDRLLTKAEIGLAINRAYPRLRGKDYEEVLSRVLNAQPADEAAAEEAARVAYLQLFGRWSQFWSGLPWWLGIFAWPFTLALKAVVNIRTVFGWVIGIAAAVYFVVVLWPIVSIWISSLNLKDGLIGPKGQMHKAEPSPLAPTLERGKEGVERIMPGASEGLTPLPPINTTPRAASGLYSPEQWEIPGYNLGQGGAGYSEPSLPPQPYQPSGGGTTISQPGDVSKLPR